ncbi:hypothetical protein C483_05343 [Natrialba hulunbeirensis JCM 10989]|uniref:Uncharacterized protein n=1 Tax=Natrialba hulunbeirensis JCM 10989 TaxID=1227493 RepID=M0A445_9EURY|nr:BGTF surface domain-containing protein [Natrialba hulunbeirensis]ELY93364.1 hypothetical protein C483_05343 [Natrialba hulunbeirensis JCM 10989]
MTNNTTFREKGRAVFLAALMVLSVVAMSATFAGAAAAQNDYYEDLEDDYDVGPTYTDPSNGDFNDNDAWIGQEITIVAESTGDDWGQSVEIHQGSVQTDSSNVEADSDNHVSTERVFEVEIGGEDYDAFEFDAAELESSELYHFIVDEGGAEAGWNGYGFWAEDEGLDVSFDDDDILEDSTVEVDFDSDRGAQIVNVTETSEGLDAEDIEDIFVNNDEADNDDVLSIVDDEYDVELHDDDDVATFEIEGDSTLTADFADIEAGEYEFEFDVTDSLADDNATVEVRDEDAERNFVNDPYIQQQGDEFNITVELEDTDDTYVTVGDFDDNAYEVGLYVSDDEGDYDEVDITFNTHKTVGDDATLAFEAQQDDAEVEVVYAQIVDNDYIAIGNDDLIDGDVQDLDADVDTSEVDDLEAYLEEPLVADDYELTTSAGLEVDDDEIDFVDRGDTSFINLEPLGSPGDVTTYTAPEDDSMNDLEDFEDATVTATDSVAEDDYLVMELEDAGMTGFFADYGDNDDEIAEDLAEDAGIYLEVEQTDAASNLGDVVWNNSADYHNTDDEQLEMTLVNGDDYEGEQLLFDIPTDQFDGDGEFEWTLEFSDRNVYIDDDEGFSLEGEFNIDEREVSLDDVDEVPNVDGAELSGDTTVAPGTEIDMVASASGEFVLTDDPVVADDRTFTGSFDFSDYDAGIEFDVEADEPLGDGEDDFTAELVDGDGPVINVEADAPSSADVGEDVTLDVTVTNTGGAAADDVDIGVVIGGDNVDDENTTIDADESWTNSYEFTSDSEGDIEWSVVADDSEETGVTNFSDEDTDDDASDDDATDDDASDDDASDDDASDDDGETDDDGDDDGTPGFGVAVALAALLGAAMLALRKQN